MKKQKEQGWRWRRVGVPSRGRAGRKIEIKGRWVIAVAWEAVGDKSNHSSNRNATPSSDHERKNSMANPPGLIALRVLEPTVLIGPILSRIQCARDRAAFSLPPILTIFRTYIPRSGEEGVSVFFPFSRGNTCSVLNWQIVKHCRCFLAPSSLGRSEMWIHVRRDDFQNELTNNEMTI